MEDCQTQDIYTELNSIYCTYRNELDEMYTGLSDRIISFDRKIQNPLHNILTIFHSTEKNKQRDLDEIYLASREQYSEREEEIENLISFSEKTNYLRKACKNMEILKDEYVGKFTKRTMFKKENYDKVSRKINIIKDHLNKSGTETETIDEWYQKYTKEYENHNT